MAEGHDNDYLGNTDTFNEDYDPTSDNEQLLNINSRGRRGSVKEDENTGSDDVVKLTGCGAYRICDPRSLWHRYTFVLVLICFLSFGSYFCYDTPAALEDTIKNDLHINVAQYTLLYSLYSWPNVILCFFGGFLIDKVFGIRVGALVFGGFVLTGQCIFALGAFINSFPCMLVGRFVFGLGGESLAVAQNTYAVTWFKEKELNMVFGLQLSFSRIGSTVNMNVNKPIYDLIDHDLEPYTRLGFTLLVGVATCVFSVICCVVVGVLDFRAEKILQRKKAGTGEVIHIRDVKDFPFSLWIIFFICVFYYITVFPFIGIGLAFVQEKYDLAYAEASIVNSLVYFVSAGASPVFGLVVDKTGCNVYWVMLGTVITLACHITLAFTFLSPYAVMVVMGLAYSILACALWPLVSFIVPQHQLGTAYGCMQSLQNLGLAVVNIVNGKIVEGSGYLLLEVFNCTMLCVAVVLCVILYLVDSAKGSGLNLTAGARRRNKAIAAAKKQDNEREITDVTGDY